MHTIRNQVVVKRKFTRRQSDEKVSQKTGKRLIFFLLIMAPKGATLWEL
jgi:hypothetical protein